jgi:hypothetical protein
MEPEVCLKGIRGVVNPWAQDAFVAPCAALCIGRLKGENAMAKYLGQGTMAPGVIEEERVDSQWKPWSIGCDVHLRTVFVAVLVPNYAEGTIHRSVVKYATDYQSLQTMKAWLLEFKKNMARRSLSLNRPPPTIDRSCMRCRKNLPQSL